MASKTQRLHFILIPFMAQGHLIPMVDIAKMLAQRGVFVTIITTPLNANRFRNTITRAVESGLKIRLVQLCFPCQEVGLPEGCETFDALPTLNSANKFFIAVNMLQEPVEQFLKEVEPPPTCLIGDICVPWTTDVAHRSHIPRLVFHGMSCFSILCIRNVKVSKILHNIASESDHFVVPGVPGQIELTKGQFPKWDGPYDDMIRAEEEADGVVVNSFMELEPEYAKEYEKVTGKKVWCIGPVLLCNKSQMDKAERGNMVSIDENHCLKWLDSCEPNSVLYVCLGSLSRLATSQMIELGLGLEASNKPFIWAIRHKSDDFQKWISEDGFEERIKRKGLLIYGWAPQALLLSHSAIGGLLTHCGWNSIIEGICFGLPMITWPTFVEQFMNEKLVVNVLRIGIMIGVEVFILPGEEESVGVQVKKNDVKAAVDKLMDGGEEGEEIRKRAMKFGQLAVKAVERGGASDVCLAQLIEDMTNHPSI